MGPHLLCMCVLDSYSTIFPHSLSDNYRTYNLLAHFVLSWYVQEEKKNIVRHFLPFDIFICGEKMSWLTFVLLHILHVHWICYRVRDMFRIHHLG